MRSTLLLVAALVACAVAQVPRVHIDKTGPLSIYKGFSTEITFTLDNPIICEDQAAYCGVVVLLTNTNTKYVKLNTCQVKWDKDEWHTPRKVTISAVENFVDDNPPAIIIRTEAVKSSSEYYNNFNPADITIVPQSRRSGSCSATGDPHYTTFDGYYYHEYGPGQMVFYQSTVRDFEVQARVYSRPALHCGIAAREGNDIVFVNRCPGDDGSISYSFNGPAATQPRVERSSSRYTIIFASGAQVYMDLASYYMNVYAVAPSADWGHAIGMCGNFNDNPNDDSPAYQVQNIPELFSSQQIKYDLWQWRVPTTLPAVTLPPYASECAYVAPTAPRPVLTNGDSEDITDIIKAVLPVGTQRPLSQFTFDETNVAADATSKPCSEAEAVTLCSSKIAQSDLGKVCAQYAGINVQTYVDNCVIDLQLMFCDPRFVNDAYNAMQAVCSEVAGRDLSTYILDANGNLIPNPAITNKLCPNNCSGKGTCNSGVCQCQQGFLDVDCSHDTSKPASVERVTPNKCDVRSRIGCPTEIAIFGNNFFDTGAVTCRFGTTLTKATVISPVEMRCTLPTNNDPRTAANPVAIAISNDGVLFSSESFTFVWYDSVCSICSATNACSPNPDACIIGGICYEKDSAQADNECKTCRPAVSRSQFSYTYTNGAKCGPKFEEARYTAQILDVTTANTVLAVVRAHNALVDADTTNKITYSLGVGASSDIKIEPDTGIVRAAVSLDPTKIDPSRYNGQSLIVATDSVGNIASTVIFLALQGTDQPPVFSQNTYTFTISENIPVGTSVGAVKATDADADKPDTAALGWGIFKYSWILQEVNFGDYFLVDADTGAIKTNKPIDFEKKATYHLQVRALDNGGMPGIADVYINVLNVNEAPTGVSISSSTIAENQPAGTLIGKVSSVDPDAADTFTYQLLSTGPFTLTGDKLYSSASFDFETKNSYAVTIKTTDQGGQSAQGDITVTVTDVNEAPSNLVLAPKPNVAITGTTITLPEDFAIQSSIAQWTISDPDAGQTSSCVVTSSDNFQVSGNQVIVSKLLDFETAPSLSFKITCADDGVPSMYSPTYTYSVVVTDANESGQNVRLLNADTISVPENAAADTFVVGVVSAVDPDGDAGAMTFESLSSDHFKFSGVPTCTPQAKGAMECRVNLVVKGGMDFETAPIDTVNVVVTDNHGKKSTSPVQVTVSDVNDAPTGITLTNNQITEFPQDGAVVGTVIVQDQDKTASNFDISLINSADGRFALIKSNGARRATTDYQIVVVKGSLLNHKLAASHDITVRVVDNGVPAFSRDLTTTVFILDRAVEIVNSASKISEKAVVGAKFATLTLNYFDNDVAATFALTNNANGFVQLTPNLDHSASLVLMKPLDASAVPQLSFTVVVTFENDAYAPAQKTFNLPVSKENKAPAWSNAYQLNPINTDSNTQLPILDVDATDEEGSPITYSLAVQGEASLFTIDTNTGAIYARIIASKAGTTHILTVSASDGIDTTTLTLTAKIVDDCYFAPGSTSSPCGAHASRGSCHDDGKIPMTPTCRCTSGNVLSASGTDCVANLNANTDASTGSGSSSSAGVGIGIGVALGILLILLIALLVLRNRRKNQHSAAAIPVDVEGGVVNGAFGAKSFDGDDTYDMPEMKAIADDFEPGVANPLYAWYVPTMSRQECEDYLGVQGEGAFVIRDSSFTPGWHMLGVKNSNNIVHERIKLNGDGTYELLPSSNVRQPVFHAIPDLVEFYTNRRDGVPFSLAMDNPLYDNHLLRDKQARAIKPLDTIYEAEAPSLPVRQVEKEQLAEFARHASFSAADELYTNTEQAKRLTIGTNC